MTALDAALIDAAREQFLLGPVVIVAATRGAITKPQLVLALACRVSPDRRQVTLTLSRAACAEMGDHVGAGSPIAVVFCRATSNVTLQLKGPRAELVDVCDDDRAAIERHREDLETELQRAGEPPGYARRLLACAPDDLLAVRFEPDELYEQTPGPQAGRPLHAAAPNGPPSECTPHPAAALATGGRAPRPGERPLGEELADTDPDAGARLPLHAIRACLEGAVPSIMATCGPDGRPNVAYLSQVQYIDDMHVALSFQFFNKTRRNVLVHPHARVVVLEPGAARAFRLDVRYLHTEATGALFETMRAKLAGIASHTGMQQVFRLKGADVYRVTAVRPVRQTGLDPATPTLPAGRPATAPRLPALRAVVEALAAAADLDGLLGTLSTELPARFGYRHLMVLLPDESGQRLYTIASHGYPASGTGSEIATGAGVIGMAADVRVPIRIGHLTADYAYSQTVRQQMLGDAAPPPAPEIPLPGLVTPGSQMAIPIVHADRLLGVLFVESPATLAFGYDDEDALVVLAAQVAATMLRLQSAADAADVPAGSRAAELATAVAATDPSPVTVRYYAANGSVFLDDDYLIKGVAGDIFWLLASDFTERGRTQFSNRELRVDRRLRLPDLADNLEARLILLQRRLVDRAACVAIEKVARGRFRLCVGRPLRLLKGD